MKIEELIKLLKGTEEVVFRINELGESVFSTKEIYECLKPIVEKQIGRKPVVESYFDLFRNGKAFEVSCPTCGEGLTYFDNLGMKKIQFKEMGESIFRNHCPPLWTENLLE